MLFRIQLDNWCFCMCSAELVTPLWCWIGYISNISSWYHQIRTISISHFCHILLWLCVWGGFTVISCESWILFLMLLCSLWYVQMVGCIVTLMLLAHYTISLSSLFRVVWRHSIYKMLVKYVLSSVCLWWVLFSPLYNTHLYGSVCYQLTHFSADGCENICASSYQWVIAQKT